MTGLVGRAVDRVDGRAKVTGAARYAADNQISGLLHGFLVLSTVARGEVTAIDTGAALAVPGVVAVYTHRDLPRLASIGFPYPKGFIPMQDTVVHHNGQPVAYVVAETLEQAQEAASLVRVDYRAERPVVRIGDALDEVYLPPPFLDEPNEVTRGDAATAFDLAEVRVDQGYTNPTHHHNPIEPHTTTAVWDGDALTLYESTQGVHRTLETVAAVFELPPASIRIIAPYLGGGFGAKAIWAHTLLTIAAARLVGRPVKLVLTRAEMYTATGHRSEFRHRVRLGATRRGRLTAILSATTAQLSRTDEAVFNSSPSVLGLYACPNVHVRQQGVRLDLATSTWMRSPEGTAHFGLETALDELSHAIGVDPVELRVRNHSDVHPHTGQPYGSKHLLACYRMAAAAFGWSTRDPRPGSMRDGDEYVGYGMATETHGFASFPATAGITIGTDGRATLRMATQDIGTGTYTVISQVVADGLGMPLTQVTTLIGDSAFPAAGISAVSATMPSVIGSVAQAAGSARDTVIRLAVADPNSPLHGVPVESVVTENGQLRAGDRRDSYRDVLTRHGRPVTATGTVLNTPGQSWGAVFVEVRVRPSLGTVRVSRVVGAYDPGRVLNRKTAHSQVIGGVTWGIGFALMEHTVVDPATGRVVNPNLSTYLVPVCADVPAVEALFVDQPDPSSTALGARGFGETPFTGVPAAIGNAIFHATGRRLRDVPFTQDKLL
ncbi:xanthine dehydrogenase family protein molybdopterin-binding subunit [Actinophytocola sediminis]